ncbi:MAG: TIGR04086 family membrane protein [Bacillota bacterium]
MSLNVDEVQKGLSLTAIGCGTLVGALTSFCATIIVACLFYFTSVSEGLFPFIVSFILFLSGALGGCLATKHAGGKALVHGTAVGVSLFMILWLAAVTVLPGPVTTGMLLQKFILLSAGGATGGFIGVVLGL